MEVSEGSIVNVPKNTFHQILSPFPDDCGVWIHQNSWFSHASLDFKKTLHYNFDLSLLLIGLNNPFHTPLDTELVIQFEGNIKAIQTKKQLNK